MRLTPSAIAKVDELLLDIQDDAELKDQVPIIVWIFNRSGLDENPGPTLGLIDRERAEAEQLDYFTNGTFKVFNGLPENLRQKFSSCTLDFRGSNFEFVDLGSN